MESGYLVSWQFENFSTAELSPPTSPVSPSSPNFYDGSNPASPSTLKGSSQSHKPAPSSVVTSRAQAASNMLNELERLHTFEHLNDFDIGANEESVDLNMNLFEELADIEYTPQLNSIDFKPSLSSASQFTSSGSSEPPMINVTQLVQSTDNNRLTAEFKSIVESLRNSTEESTTSNNVGASLGNVIKICGIPTTTIVGDECLVPVEFISSSNCIGAEEAESLDLDGIIIENEMEMDLIDENNLFTLGELSGELSMESESSKASIITDGNLPPWAKDIIIPLDELDTAMNRNVDTLDALLNGDVSAAKGVLEGYYPTVVSPVSSASEEPEMIEDEDFKEEVVPVVVAPKIERRGRKPLKKDSLNYVKDKALRKKEQNKTAATRYRIKKKQELGVTLAEEDVLQAEHDELQKQKDKINSEVQMIRSLLREMLEVRKKRVTPTPISAGRVTASSIVQAQKRVANRRK